MGRRNHKRAEGQSVTRMSSQSGRGQRRSSTSSPENNYDRTSGETATPQEQRSVDFFSLPGSRTSSGRSVNENLAWNLSAWYAGVSLIAQTMAIMPCKVYRKGTSDSAREEITDHPASNVVGWSPDDEMTAFQYFETSTAHIITRGNHVAEAGRNGRGQCKRLWILDPREIEFDRDRNGKRLYRQMGSKPIEMSRSECLHVAAFSPDGYKGKSVLNIARESIGLGLAGERYGSEYFGQGGRPPGFLTKPTRLTKTERETMRAEWEEMHNAELAWRVGVLSGGLGWESIASTPEECQFLQTRLFQVDEIARWLRIPPHMLANMTKEKFTSIENMLLQFLTFTMFPWIKRWEGELNRTLFTPKEQFNYYCEFSFDALLRADSKTKFENYERMLKTAMRTPDELRRMDNLPPYPNGIGSKPMIMNSQFATLEFAVNNPGGLTQKKQGDKTSDKKPSESKNRLLNHGFAHNVIDLHSQLDERHKEKLLVAVGCLRGKNMQEIEEELSCLPSF